MAVEDQGYDDLHIQRLRSHEERTLAKKTYSIQKFDLLVVTLSGAGIYTIFEMLKFLKTTDPFKGQNIETTVLEWSGGLFVASVIVNFLSHWSGFKANALEARCIMKEFKLESKNLNKKDRQNLQSDIEKLDGNITAYNTITTIFNVIATVTVLLGIVLLLKFTIATF
jgi:hypothetical protein